MARRHGRQSAAGKPSYKTKNKKQTNKQTTHACLGLDLLEEEVLKCETELFIPCH
jgi:hypothetical protein